ncbi:MAG: hypothetical protein AAFP84_07615 [Actinomycetota bacterium]
MRSPAVLDTPPEVLAAVTDRWRVMSAWDRFERVAELNDSCEQLAEVGVRQRHPAADEHEVRLRVLALRLGRDLMVSERQLRDVLSILRVQAGRIDREQLLADAAPLGLADLVARALEEERCTQSPSECGGDAR